MSYFINILGLLLFVSGGLNVPERLNGNNIEFLEANFVFGSGIHSLNWDPTYCDSELKHICAKNYLVKFQERITDLEAIRFECHIQMIPENRRNVVWFPNFDVNQVVLVTLLECTCSPTNQPYTEEMYRFLHKVFYLVEDRQLQVLNEDDAVVHNGAVGIVGIGDEVDNEDNGEVLNNGQNENNAAAAAAAANDDDYTSHKYFHLMLEKTENNVRKYLVTEYWKFD